MKTDDIIKKAAELVCSKKVKGGLLGDVGCVLVTEKGTVFEGVCASVGSNNFCAEQNAIGSMITNREFSIKKIVAVWKDEKGEVYVIPPCGNCRQLMREVNEENLEKTEVVLSSEKVALLKELLPYYDSWEKVE